LVGFNGGRRASHMAHWWHPEPITSTHTKRQQPMPPFGSVCRHKWLQVHRRTSVAAWILRRGLRYSYFVCSELLISCASNRAVTKGTCYCQMWTFSCSHGRRQDATAAPETSKRQRDDGATPRTPTVRAAGSRRTSIAGQSHDLGEISSMVAKPSVKM